jgi:hypothetical protein
MAGVARLWLLGSAGDPGRRNRGRGNRVRPLGAEDLVPGSRSMTGPRAIATELQRVWDHRLVNS